MGLVLRPKLGAPASEFFGSTCPSGGRAYAVVRALSPKLQEQAIRTIAIRGAHARVPRRSDSVHERGGIEGQRLDLRDRVDSERLGELSQQIAFRSGLRSFRRCRRVRKLLGCRGGDFVLLYSVAEHA